MPVHLKTTADIDATPQHVWAVLSDLPAYADWNPFMPSASGTLAEGQRLDIELRPPTGKGMRIRPTVRTVTAGRELRWLGRLLVPGLFDGDHRFTIQPTATGCRLVHEERFTGLLVPLFAKSLRSRYLPAFEQMNIALAQRVTAQPVEVVA
jgi:hypothetical protein